MARERATPDDLLHHAEWMRRLARTLVSDRALADDVAQEAWMAALRRPPETDRPLRPWLGRVVANLARNTRRGENRRKARETARFEARHADAAIDVAAELELQRLLLAAIESLSEPQRSTLVRTYFHGRTSADIAGEDGVAESTVRGRVQLAIEALRLRLDAHHHGRRGAWVAILLPVAESKAWTPTQSATVAAVGTVFTMSLLVKVGLAAAVVVAVAALAWKPAQVSVEPALVHAEPSAQSTPLEDVPRAGREQVANVAAVEEARVDKTQPLDAAPPAAKSPAVIEARVVDAHGNPIAGAEMICVDRISARDLKREQAPSAKSSFDGVVRLELTRADENRFQGRASNTPADTWRARLEISAPAKTMLTRVLDLREGHAASLGVVVLTDGGSIAGRVVDETGSPVGNAGVQLFLPDIALTDRDDYALRGKRSLDGANVLADGTYEFPSVATGFYRVWARPPGRLGALSDPFEVRAGETTRVADLVVLDNPRIIRGVVNDEAGRPTFAEVEYLLSAAAGNEFWTDARVERDGTFLIESFSTPTVDIHAERDHSTTGGDGVALVRGVPAGARDVVLTLRPHRTLEVTVQDEQGAAIADYHLMVVKMDGTGRGGTVADAGPRPVRAPTRPFRLEISKAGFIETSFGPYDPEHLPERAVLTLRTAGHVAGRVTVEGAPVADAEVCLAEFLPEPVTRMRNGFLPRVQAHHSVRTSDDGSFALELDRPGRFVVVTRKSPFASAESRMLDLDPARGVTEVDLVLTRGGSVTGRVTGFGEAANEARFVTASNGTDWLVGAPIEEDGTYTLARLAPGTWWLRPTAEELNGSGIHTTVGPPDGRNRSVVVAEGVVARLDLDARPGTPIVMHGRLRIAGVDMRTWTVGAKPLTSDDHAWISGALGADGSFRMELKDEVRHNVRFRSAGTDRRSDAIELEVDVASEMKRIDIELATGSISAPTSPSGDLAIAVKLANGATWTTQLRCAAGQAFHVDGLPAGAIVVHSGARVVGSGEVKVGSESQISWD